MLAHAPEPVTPTANVEGIRHPVGCVCVLGEKCERAGLEQAQTQYWSRVAGGDAQKTREIQGDQYHAPFTRYNVHKKGTDDPVKRIRVFPCDVRAWRGTKRTGKVLLSDRQKNMSPLLKEKKKKQHTRHACDVGGSGELSGRIPTHCAVARELEPGPRDRVVVCRARNVAGGPKRQKPALAACGGGPRDDVGGNRRGEV